jgi:hypothetical protein
MEESGEPSEGNRDGPAIVQLHNQGVSRYGYGSGTWNFKVSS